MSSASEPADPTRRWNHNLQFHRWILENAPVPCEKALDAGCGDGVLTSKLAERARFVTGIDISPAMIASARDSVGAENVTFIHGDLLSYPLPPGNFDFIAAVAVLHHMPFAVALRRMSVLLRSGGVLAAIGLARNSSLADYTLSAASIPVSRLFQVRSGWWNSPAPQIDPDMSYAEIRQTSKKVLPGVAVRRRLFFRYTLLWQKP